MKATIRRPDGTTIEAPRGFAAWMPDTATLECMSRHSAGRPFQPRLESDPSEAPPAETV